jgi:hypothetical protein
MQNRRYLDAGKWLSGRSTQRNRRDFVELSSYSYRVTEENKGNLSEWFMSRQIIEISKSRMRDTNIST